jgi:hypothetical protein
MAQSTKGNPPMAPELWLHPYPAQSDDFLQLHYVNQYGRPDGAATSLYLHPWAVHDCMGMAAEVEIVRESDDGYRVRVLQYLWNAWESGASLTSFERYNGCTVTLWDSHETFGQFFDAEALALFAWSRWRATGSAGRAGLRWRDDLDSRLNPVPPVLA